MTSDQRRIRETVEFLEDLLDLKQRGLVEVDGASEDGNPRIRPTALGLAAQQGPGIVGRMTNDGSIGTGAYAGARRRGCGAP